MDPLSIIGLVVGFSAILFGRVGLRRYEQPFGQRDTDFFTGGDTGWVDATVSGEPNFVQVSIPTLGEWGMIAFITLLLGVGVFVSRRRINA